MQFQIATIRWQQTRLNPSSLVFLWLIPTRITLTNTFNINITRCFPNATNNSSNVGLWIKTLLDKLKATNRFYGKGQKCTSSERERARSVIGHVRDVLPVGKQVTSEQRQAKDNSGCHLFTLNYLLISLKGLY